jgi:hypothetical protein
MTSVLETVRAIVHPARIVKLPGELTEDAKGSRSGPILVRYEGESWALRLKDGDHLPVLAELAKERSVRRLPDYLVFSAPPSEEAADTWSETLRVLVCELKSSAVGATSAVPQLQFGKLLTEYLLRIAAHSAGRADPPKSWCCGLIASPEFPAAMMAKGRTRPGKVEFPSSFDDLSRMRIHQMPGSGEIRLESFFG